MTNIIIGAGLAGVSAAHFLHRHGETSKIIEKTKHLGGRIQSREVGEDIVEVGAQYLAKADTEALKLIQEIDSDLLVQAEEVKASFIYDGKKLAAPFPLCFRTPIMHSIGIVRGTLQTMWMDGNSPELKKILFPQWFDETFGPDSRWFFDGIIRSTTTPPEKISAWNGVNILKAMFSTPYSIQGGLSEMVHAIARRNEGSNVQFDTDVVKIEFDGQDVKNVYLSDGRSIRADYVICTSNASTLTKLVKEKAYSVMKRVEYSPATYMYIRTAKPILEKGENIAFAESSPAVSVLNRSTVRQNLYGILTIDPSLCRLPEDKLLGQLLDSVAPFIPLRDDSVMEYKAFRWKEGLPILNPELHALHEKMNDFPIQNLILAGDYTTFPSMEGAVVSAKNAVRKIRQPFRAKTK